jgi:hypothetical protein
LARSRLNWAFLPICLGPPAAALAGEPGLARLRHLDLTEGPIGDAGAAALAASPHVVRLRKLELRSCGITGPGALALAVSPHLTSLRTLYISGNPIYAGAQARLRKRFSTDLRE